LPLNKPTANCNALINNLSCPEREQNHYLAAVQVELIGKATEKEQQRSANAGIETHLHTCIYLINYLQF